MQITECLSVYWYLGKHILEWRNRWTVLTEKYLLTFKAKGNTKATESIQLSSITSVTPSQNGYFKLKSTQFYHFKADSESQATQWIQWINKYRQNTIKVSIIIECQRNAEFNSNFEKIVPYSNTYFIITFFETVYHMILCQFSINFHNLR